MEGKWRFVNCHCDSPHGEVTGLQVSDCHNYKQVIIFEILRGKYGDLVQVGTAHRNVNCTCLGSLAAVNRKVRQAG